MKYLLLIHTDETCYDRMTEAENRTLMSRYGDFGTAAREAGVLVDANRLRPTTTATTVRVRDDQVLATDGPFAETKEQLGGYYMIDVEDLDEAIEWASRLPGAGYGCVEVRPIWDMTADA